MYISSSLEEKIFEIPLAGAALIAGYWSPDTGICSNSVLVEWKDGRICALNPWSSWSSLKDKNNKKLYPKEILQWKSYYLLPGWLDAHVHLALDSIDFYKCMDNWEKPSMMDERIQAFLRHYLELGIVGIRDGGDLPGFAWKAKQKVLEGKWIGPQIKSVREAVHKTGMYGRFLGRGFRNIDEWLDNSQDFLSQGADQLKVIVTGIIKFDNYGEVSPTQWTIKELSDLVNNAHEKGISVMAHASGEEGISVAIAAGVDSIEHGYYVTSKQLELMKEKQIAWVPTVAPIGNILKYQSERYSALEKDVLIRILKGHLSKIYKAYLLNISLGVGTDAGAYLVPHADSLFDEIAWMVEAGIPKLEVYRMATQENARILGMQEFGTLAIGTPMNLLQLRKTL